MTDTVPSAETRMQFLFALRSRGVTDARVLGAMESIDRIALRLLLEIRKQVNWNTTTLSFRKELEVTDIYRAKIRVLA